MNERKRREMKPQHLRKDSNPQRLDNQVGAVSRRYRCCPRLNYLIEFVGGIFCSFLIGQEILVIGFLIFTEPMFFQPFELEHTRRQAKMQSLSF